MGSANAFDEIPNRDLSLAPLARQRTSRQDASRQREIIIMMKWLYFSTEWNIAVQSETDES